MNLYGNLYFECVNQLHPPLRLFSMFELPRFFWQCSSLHNIICKCYLHSGQHRRGGVQPPAKYYHHDYYYYYYYSGGSLPPAKQLIKWTTCVLCTNDNFQVAAKILTGRYHVPTSAIYVYMGILNIFRYNTSDIYLDKERLSKTSWNHWSGI